MSRKERIEKALTNKFSPTVLRVSDFSHEHRAGPDAQSHIEVYMIAEAFDGLNLIKKHRLVYAALQEELQSGLHALKLQIFGTEDQAQSQTKTPRCKGG